jgi:D-arabinan exo alpha-(1,3)/(1,5)-arabinofuranosidase (non-reducing end)
MNSPNLGGFSDGGSLHAFGSRESREVGFPETHQLTTFDPAKLKKTRALSRGQRVTIGEVKGRGYIANLWLTMPNWFWGHWAPDTPVHQSLLKTVILRIYWDGAEHPAVEAPVGDFFGVGLCRAANFASQYFGMSSGGFFSKFPMPFRTGFRIELENMDEHADTEAFMNVVYQLDDHLDDDIRYFHAQFHTGENDGPDPMPIASFEGKGLYIGCSLSMQGEQKCYLSYLEAPEHIYVDDDWDTPRIIGTGLEDYFLGGWYFREGCFTGPLHGLTVKDVIHAAVAMYRIHDLDAVYFTRRFRMEFVNHWERERLKQFRYSSVAYAMLDKPMGSGRDLPSVDQLMCWYRIRDVDHSWDGQ